MYNNFITVRKKNKLPVHAALGVGSRKKENLRILLTLEVA